MQQMLNPPDGQRLFSRRRRPRRELLPYRPDVRPAAAPGEARCARGCRAEEGEVVCGEEGGEVDVAFFGEGGF